MGRETTTEIRIDTQVATAKVLLEGREIIVRGELRRRFLFSEISGAVSRAGWLRFDCGGAKVAIELGDDAEAWLARLKNPPSRVSRLRIKPGMRVCVVGDVEDGVAEEMERSGMSVTTRLAGTIDVVLFFAEKESDLARLEAMPARLAEGGAVWVLWRKGSGAVLSHEAVVDAGKAAGLSQTISIGFSPTRTGLRLVRSKK